MQLPEGTRLAYVVTHEAWYYRDGKPSVTVMAAAGGGGVAWEFAVEEFRFRGEPATQVQVFEDAYAAFAQLPEFFGALAAGEGTTLADVIKLLDLLGAVDKTERRGPGRQPGRPAGPHDETVREALRLAARHAPTDSAAGRFTAVLDAMGGA